MRDNRAELTESQNLNKNERIKNEKTNEFTVKMALFDFLPCLFFAAGGAALAFLTENVLVIIGVLCAAAAGFCKAAWKLRMALNETDKEILRKLFRILMPVGFGLMVFYAAVNAGRTDWYSVWKTVSAFPQAVFFLICILGMGCMGVFAKKLDQTKAKSNWAEEATNFTAQLSFMIAMFLIAFGK